MAVGEKHMTGSISRKKKIFTLEYWEEEADSWYKNIEKRMPQKQSNIHTIPGEKFTGPSAIFFFYYGVFCV